MRHSPRHDLCPTESYRTSCPLCRHWSELPGKACTLQTSRLNACQGQRNVAKRPYLYLAEGRSCWDLSRRSRDAASQVHSLPNAIWPGRHPGSILNISPCMSLFPKNGSPSRRSMCPASILGSYAKRSTIQRGSLLELSSWIPPSAFSIWSANKGARCAMELGWVARA